MVATQIFFMFTPKLGEDEPNLNIFQMGGSTTNVQINGLDSWMYPDLNIPVWEIPILGGYFWVKKSPREHQLNAMGTLFGLHPIVP